TRFSRDWSSDVCSSDLATTGRSVRSWTTLRRRRAARPEPNGGDVTASKPAGQEVGEARGRHAVRSTTGGPGFHRLSRGLQRAVGDRKSVVEGTTTDDGG